MSPADQLALNATLLGSMLPGSPQWFAAACAAAIVKRLEQEKKRRPPQDW